MAGRLSDEQFQTILRICRERGNIAMAAHMAGIAPSRLKALMTRDESLAMEVNDQLEIFNGAIFAHALERATVGKSDAILAKILEAKVQGFSKETRETTTARNKPTGLTLRTFDEEGREVGSQAVSPSTSGAPLLLDMHRGL
jgi:hypothetical protein